MKVFKSVNELVSYRERNSNLTGFVPTMGALHPGHLSLIKKSKSENEETGCSIFVNPIQFNNSEDFQKYPNTLQNDLEMLESEDCDWAFTPSVDEMYPTTPLIRVNFGILETVMEGAFRPGHFSGVAIVVSKLFNASRPNTAYFGRKDLQQTLVIKQLVSDLGFNLNIKVEDTYRETDGLAMSSRNVRLDSHQRQVAPIIYQTLQLLSRKIMAGADIVQELNSAFFVLEESKEIKMEYLHVVNANTLEVVDNLYSGEIAICIACYLGNVRLIDNLVFTKL